jgi:tetratricopeptide (TPR) repeat protein
MFRSAYVCAVVRLVSTNALASSRLNFERTVPAPHSLGSAEDLLISYAIGDNDKISTFIDVFIDQANREGTLRVLDPMTVERSTERSHRWRKPPKYVLQRYRADAYLRIDAFRCTDTERTGEGSSYNVDGNRVRGTQRWIDAVCIAHVDALATDRKTKLAELSVQGEGTSARVMRVTAEDRDVAEDQAARYAAIAAAEQIRPRRVRESIELIENAPDFEVGMSYIDSGEFDSARREWEKSATKYRASAALQFNLAAVCEAVGDNISAEVHYATAEKLEPKDSRYRFEHEMFRKRAGIKK